MDHTFFCCDLFRIILYQWKEYVLITQCNNSVLCTQTESMKRISVCSCIANSADFHSYVASYHLPDGQKLWITWIITCCLSYRLCNETNMNLQSLLHDTLLASGHVESCAVFKKKDFAVTAASIGYQVFKNVALAVWKQFVTYLLCFSISLKWNKWKLWVKFLTIRIWVVIKIYISMGLLTNALKLTSIPFMPLRYA